MPPTTRKDHDHENTALEFTIFKTICILGIITSCFILLLDIFISGEIISIILDAAGILIFSLYYLLARHTREFRLFVHPFMLTIITFLNLAWFSGGGMNIPNVLILILVLVVTLIVAPENARTGYLVLLVVNTFLLSGLELMKLPYSDPGIDLDENGLLIIILLFLSTGILAYIIIFFKKKYNDERMTIRGQMKELDQKNTEIAAQNVALIRNKEEISRQREHIESNNLKLQEQAEELHEANSYISSINEELERKVKERTREIDDLFYHSSHDFRRPLTTLLGLQEVARLTTRDAQTRELFSKVEETTRNMDSMLKKFLMLYNINHYRDGSQHKDFSEIERLIDEMAGSNKNIRLEKQITIRHYNRKDPRNTLIEIIVRNLLENSMTYARDDHPEIWLKIMDSAENFYISLRDNGQGIPDNVRAHIFDMYYRGNTRSNGNGLGLYIVKKASEALGAEVKLESESMKYTLFDINFKI
jgi:signal transduction histidine kinase